MLVSQSCPTLCDSMDCSSPGSSVHGILQVRILEWASIPFSRRSSQPRGWTCVSGVSCISRWILYHWATWKAQIIPGWLVKKKLMVFPQGANHVYKCISWSLKVKVKSLSHFLLFGTIPWTVAYQALLSMGFSRQEYWSGLPFPSPGDLPNPGVEPGCSAL